MERFYNSDENQDEDKDPYYESEEGEESEVVGYMDQKGILDVMHMDLAQSELNQSLLNQAIEIATTNWFWRFKSNAKKMSDIELIYKKLFSMLGYGISEDVDGEEELEEEEGEE